MKLIEAYFSWVVDEESESNTILFPNMRQAKKRANELIKSHIEEHLAECRKYDTEPQRVDLTVDFDQVTVTKLTPEAFCQIINTSGGLWVVDRKRTHTIEAHWKPKGKLEKAKQ